MENVGVVFFGRFCVKMESDDETTYPFVLRLMVYVADVLSSVIYREFDGKFRTGSYEYMTHTLISYLFNIVSLFVKHVKLSQRLRCFKYDGSFDPQHFHIPMMIQKIL